MTSECSICYNVFTDMRRLSQSLYEGNRTTKLGLSTIHGKVVKEPLTSLSYFFNRRTAKGIITYGSHNSRRNCYEGRNGSNDSSSNEAQSSSKDIGSSNDNNSFVSNGSKSKTNENSCGPICFDCLHTYVESHKLQRYMKCTSPNCKEYLTTNNLKSEVLPCAHSQKEAISKIIDYIKTREKEEREANARQVEAIAEDWVRKNGKRCPHCKQGIERTVGCNFMSCSLSVGGCGKSFCYRCGKPWDKEGISHTCS